LSDAAKALLFAATTRGCGSDLLRPVANRCDDVTEVTSRLRERLREVRTQEENQRRLIAYEKARAERDRLAAELKAVYPQVEAATPVSAA
jgi:hypothetical protein